MCNPFVSIYKTGEAKAVSSKIIANNPKLIDLLLENYKYCAIRFFWRLIQYAKKQIKLLIMYLY